MSFLRCKNTSPGIGGSESVWHNVTAIKMIWDRTWFQILFQIISNAFYLGLIELSRRNGTNKIVETLQSPFIWHPRQARANAQSILKIINSI
jgi:hypothetical protein